MAASSGFALAWASKNALNGQIISECKVLKISSRFKFDLSLVAAEFESFDIDMFFTPADSLQRTSTRRMQEFSFAPSG
jgi:hypothetical protein